MGSDAQHGNRHVKITLSRTKIPCKQFYEQRCYAGFFKNQEKYIDITQIFCGFFVANFKIRTHTEYITGISAEKTGLV